MNRKWFRRTKIKKDTKWCLTYWIFPKTVCWMKRKRLRRSRISILKRARTMKKSLHLLWLHCAEFHLRNNLSLGSSWNWRVDTSLAVIPKCFSSSTQYWCICSARMSLKSIEFRSYLHWDYYQWILKDWTNCRLMTKWSLWRIVIYSDCFRTCSINWAIQR